MNAKRFAIGAWVAIAGLASITAIAYETGYRINTTASVPVGVWRVAPGQIERGEIVEVCPPDNLPVRIAAARGYIPAGACSGNFEPLYKPVAAVAGDVVQVSPAGITVNGQSIPNSAQMAHDTAGRALPPIPAGRYTVARGFVWLVSRYNGASFDSRYFGPVLASNIQGVATPVWTAGGAP